MSLLLLDLGTEPLAGHAVNPVPLERPVKVHDGLPDGEDHRRLGRGGGAGERRLQVMQCAAHGLGHVGPAVYLAPSRRPHRLHRRRPVLQRAGFLP